MDCSRNTDRPHILYFQSGGHAFVLDIHTNRIFTLDADESHVIQAWLRHGSLADLSKHDPNTVHKITAMQDEGLFCNRAPEGLAFGSDWKKICDQIMNERARTVLEITQQCNLRCKYCTYGGGFVDHRTHGPKAMNEDTITKAIDQAISHSARVAEISIGFYGGEPLLEWERLEAGVLHAQAQARSLDRRVRFALTTNATLLDEEKARFLKDAGFSVLVSLDGPQFVHDQYRVYPNGKGSYGDTVRGLKNLLDGYPLDMHGKIGLSMVIPSSKWITYSETLWDEEPWLPRTLRTQVSMVRAPTCLPRPNLPHKLDDTGFREKWLQQLDADTETSTPVLGAMFNHTMAKLHQRPRFQGQRRTFFPNGCCIPGARKVFVQAGGDYQICERVHGVPTIGSVTQGIDLSSIKRIVDEYTRTSFADCKTCFAISTCTLCFLHAYESGRFSVEKKRAACSRAKSNLESTLKVYGLVSTLHPDKLDEWDAVDIM